MASLGSMQSAGYTCDFDADDDIVLVVFAGLARDDQAAEAHPHFEFLNAVGDLPVGKVFLRDLDQVWYHQGVHGLGRSIADVRAALADLVVPGRRLVFVGGSSGGYAALLFGALVGADAVVAFCPQTFLTRRLRARHYDRRLRSEISRLRRSPAVDRRYLDLRPVLRRHTGSTRMRIHYGARNRLDAVHATRLLGAPHLTVHPEDTQKHAVHRSMRDADRLEPVLLDALGLSRASPH